MPSLAQSLANSLAFSSSDSIGGGNAFTVEWTVSGDAAARTVTLPLVDTRAEGSLSYNCVIDWGDGSALSFVTAYDDANRIHTYASNGTYRMKVFGVMEGWSFANGGDCAKLTAIINWGSAPAFDGFKYLYQGFYGCSNLTSIGTSPIPASGTGILSDGFYMAFRGCSNLASVSANLFSLHPNVSGYSFNRCFLGTGITSIPSGLFINNNSATDMEFAFYQCASLTTIESGAFDGLTSVTSFSYCFAEDTSLTSVPSGLFDDCTAVTDFSFLFYKSALTTIPSGLFDNNTAVTTFSACFQQSDLSSIPSGLFDYTTAVTTVTSAFRSTDITAIPSGLFDSMTLITDASYLFYACLSLTAIPSGLFDNNTAIDDLMFCFCNCPITSIPSGLLDYLTALINARGVFKNTDITTIPSGLFDNNTAITSLREVFMDCELLTTTPSELFRLNTACINFTDAFSGCVKHQENIDLFYQSGEEATRFLNQDVDFTRCFDRDSFTGTQGTAPDLWNCSFGTGTPTTTDCWNGAGNSASSLTNYASIPGGWL